MANVDGTFYSGQTGRPKSSPESPPDLQGEQPFPVNPPNTGSGIVGYGTLNYIPKWTPNGNSLSNSRLIDDGVSVYFDNQDSSTHFGFEAGLNNDLTSNQTTAIGYQTAKVNTIGTGWTALGTRAAFSSTTGLNFTALGTNAGFNNINGNNWLSIGINSGFNNTSGGGWLAFGRDAGFSNTTGSNWTAIGFNAARSNITNSDWVAIGVASARNNTSGTNWVAIGSDAGRRYNAGSDTANFTNSIYIGTDTRVGATDADNEIVIGNLGRGDGSNSTVIGNTSTLTSRLYGTLRIGTINNLGSTPTSVLVPSATGVVSLRTLAELASDGLGSKWTDVGSDIYRNSKVLVGSTSFIDTGANFEVSGRISQVGVGNSIFIGQNTGRVDDFSANGNVFIGFQVGFNNTTGQRNIALGYRSAYTNVSGNNFTAIGSEAGYNSNSNSWTAIGHEAGRANTSGINWVAIGVQAALSNNGSSYVSIGTNSARNLTSGSNWIAIGHEAGRRLADASNATSFSNSIYIGEDTRVSANSVSNEIVIGHNAIGVGSNTVVLGNTSIVLTVLRGTVNMADLPTSSAGLNTGDLWNDSGTLKIA